MKHTELSPEYEVKLNKLYATEKIIRQHLQRSIIADIPLEYWLIDAIEELVEERGKLRAAILDIVAEVEK